MKKQKLPKWFTGELYTHGAEVTNPFFWRKLRADRRRIKYL